MTRNTRGLCATAELLVELVFFRMDSPSMFIHLTSRVYYVLKCRPTAGYY